MASATPAKTPTPPPKQKVGFLSLFAGVFLAIGAVAMLPTTLIILVGMIPTAVAYFVDTSKERSLGPTVFYLNFAGVLPALLRLWKQGHTPQNAIDILTQPFILFMMFFPASFGWLLYTYVPQFVSLLLRRRAESRIETLEKDQKTLLDQWGPEVGIHAISDKSADKKAAAKSEDSAADEESFTA